MLKAVYKCVARAASAAAAFAILPFVPAAASTYYVSNSGSDSNPGSSASSPWQSVARVNTGAFNPGDSILFQRGGIWREQLIPPSSGSAANPITISAYGSGANPVISGANVVSQWNRVASAGGQEACSYQCVFDSGMETPIFADWSQLYAPAVDGTSVTQTSSLANSGSYSAQLTGTGLDNRGGFTEFFAGMASETSLYFRFYIYIPPGALKPNDHFLIFQVPARGSNLSLSTDGNGNISGVQFYSVGGSILPETPVSFVMGAWNYFDVGYKVGYSDGGGAVWLNGLPLGGNYTLNTMSSKGVNSATLGNDSFGHGQVAGGSIYLDDFKISLVGPIGSLSAAAPSQVWYANLPQQPNVVFLSGALGTAMASPALLSAPGQWSWSQGVLYVYNPSVPPSNVEAAQRDYGLLLGQYGSGSNVVVSGIDFRIANSDVVHIVNTSGDTITGGLITGGYQFGVFAIGVSGSKVSQLSISNNTISLNGSSGIEISSGHAHVTIQGNTVFGNAYNPQNSGNFQFMAGIYLYDNSGSPNYDLVQQNTSSNNGVVGGTESQGSGIWMDTVSYSTMQSNTAFNNAAHGLFLEKNTNSVMADNVAYSNGLAPNSANITCYASFGVPASGNVVENNTSWGSKGMGLKVGAYQGGGETQFNQNTFQHNIIVNSDGIDFYVDAGANNDGIHGTGNVYLANTFGQETANWIYWVGSGSISTYAELSAVYGGSMGSGQVGWTPLSAQETCAGACVFASGMEIPGLSDWSSVYQPATDGTKMSLTSAFSNSGTYSLQLTGGGADNRGGVTESFAPMALGQTLYFRFYIYVPLGGLRPNDSFLIFQAPARGANVALETDGNGNVAAVQFYAGSMIVPPSPMPFAMGAWNYIEVAFKVAAYGGGGQIWCNGISVGSNYTLDTSGNVGVSSATLGNDSYGHGQVAGGSIFLDNFKMATAGPIGPALVGIAPATSSLP
jgi:parallel beta-helix repeat protein